jgi:hypothetical protein
MGLDPHSSVLPQGAVLSVDLASRRCQDIGIAAIGYDDGTVHARFVNPHRTLPKEPPSVDVLASFLSRIADETRSLVIFIDGPQGWKHPENGHEYSRTCERLLATPGKTGLPGAVKPASWTRMADFSIRLFDALDYAGYPRLVDASDLSGAKRVAIESFPTSAWRSLGLKPLAGKSKDWRAHVEDRLKALRELIPISLDEPPSHDELQALIAGLAGLSLLGSRTINYSFTGEKPVRLEGTWREGFIVNPTRSAIGLVS